MTNPCCLGFRLFNLLDFLYHLRMQNIAKWVKAARAHAQFTQTQLADRVHRSKGNVSHWEQGKHLPTYEMMMLIAQVTGYPLPQSQPKEPSNVTAGPRIVGLVPLISWVQAGNWAEIDGENFEPHEWLPCPVHHSPRTFALRVRGDSMTASHGRSYPEGSIIFVDPEKRCPTNGQRIIARAIDSGNEATFKIYKNEDGRQWLQPLNPSHQPIRDPFEVIGTVIGLWIPE